MDLFHLHRGDAPLLISIPHAGTYIPPEIASDFSDVARSLPDTDWHVHRLYDFATELDATILIATHARYVVDLNRSPDGQSLYRSQDETEIVPTSSFDREPIYRPGTQPGPAQIAARIDEFWWPYHAALGGELERLQNLHGKVVLFDAHSIRSRVQRFFDDLLPHLNLGSRGGQSAAPELVTIAAEVLAQAEGFSLSRDGRFQGGYITRAGGNPKRGIHALQLEIAQRTYMEETPPYAYNLERAAAIRPTLRALVAAIIEWAHAAPAPKTSERHP